MASTSMRPQTPVGRVMDQGTKDSAWSDAASDNSLPLWRPRVAVRIDRGY